VKIGQPYYLAKDRMVEVGRGNVQRQMVDSFSDNDMVSVSFEIDPSISKIEDENVKLAQYLMNSYINIDIYDADSKFLYGCCKVPLYELCR